MKGHTIQSFIFIVLLSQSLWLAGQDKRPNIVLIMADDLGYECITANGGTSYNTPNIDKLALQGVRFENCHSQPLCTPSRVQIMTGQYNVRNYTQFAKLERNQTTFGNLFKNAGYKTAIAGKWQLGKENDSPQHFGFDASCLWQQSLPRADDEGHDTRFSNPILEVNGKVTRFNNGEYGPDIVSDFLCDFIETNQKEPFFVYYPMILTHCPFGATPNSGDYNPKSNGSLTYKGEPKYFPDMVSYMDMLVGKVISKIDELGLGDNTLIIFTGDNGTDKPIVSKFNGEDYIGGKGKTSDNGTHVPLFVRWNDRIAPNKECKDLVDFSDFLPTICEAAGVQIPSNMTLDGTSFLPQLFGKKGSPRQWIYSWYSRNGKKANAKEWARNKHYKLYKTGEFYKVINDLYEGTPVDVKDLNNEEQRNYKSLKKALYRYGDVHNTNE